MIAKWVANSDVAVDSERHCYPDGGVDRGELQNLQCVVYGRRKEGSQDEILQDEINKHNEEENKDVSSSQSQEIVVGGLLTTQHQLGQDNHSQDVS